jgi:hypothetical protein
MIKLAIIFVLIINTLFIFSLNENVDELIKRKIIILPFVNKNKIMEYDYLSDIMMETLRGELLDTNIYEFTNFSMTDDILKNKEYKQEDFMDFKIAKKIALQFNADVVITGQFIIFEKRILVLIHAIDILTGELAAMTKVEGNIGVELFSVINIASKDMTTKITNALPMLDKEKYEKKVNLNNIKFYLTPMNKAGIGLISSGGFLILLGVPILVYDLTGNIEILRINKERYLNTNENYSDYDRSYNIFTGLFIASICTASIGVVLAIIGFTLLFIKINKKDNVALILGLNNNIRYFNNGLNFFIRIRM